MRTLVRLCFVLGLFLAFAVPANAVEGATFREERVFFTCGDENKARIVNTLQGEHDSWSTTAPASVQTGAGCGTTSSAFGDEELSGLWEGTFTGNLDSLTIEAHVIDVGLARVDGQLAEPGEYFIFPTLSIDGQTVFDPETSLDVGFERSSTNATVKLVFTLTGIDIDNEVGDGTQPHTIRLRMSGTNGWQGLWVWGTSEVPSGITFNPAVPAERSFPV